MRLEDGSSNQPIMVKLFSTSQPETHHKLHPLSVVVCTRLKLIRADGTDFYLMNSTYTQVYCTGLGQHSQMSYRRLLPVRRFLRWLRSQDDGQVLSRALIGGFFIHPPPPTSLETYMKDKRGVPGFLRGAELQMEVERLCYRERRTFCIQAAVTMVTYSRRGEEDRCLFWLDRSSSVCSSSSLSPSTPRSSSSSLFSPPSTPRSSSSSLLPPPSLSSLLPPSLSPSSAVSPLVRRPGRRKRKQQLQTDTPLKRRPLVTMRPKQTNETVVLFEASMEFLESTDADEEDDDDEDASSFVTAPFPPALPPIAAETLPMRYDHAHREEQAVAVAMGGGATGRFEAAADEYFTLRLRALSDAVSLNVLFLPYASSSSLSPPPRPHSNTWTSILSHGAFSSHTPPPSPADLIGMATQLANQRLVCVLEACHLGGATTELVLSRAFPLNH
ncbi:RPA-related protein RADX [Clinocottus analis]|uniref:RPA-related protein RADX n=1 Tax=Clinocottus analis TaxID=304258 RepID=UPI0035C1B561